MELNGFLEQIGAKMERIRKSKGITRASVAAVLETDKANYAKMEIGKVNITVKTILKISEALDVEPFELLKP